MGEEVVRNKIPRHVAIIMDGNGRWARDRGRSRLDGHRAGAKRVRDVVEACAERGVRYLTLFSFSSENWNRSRDEVNALMKLFRRYLDSELESLTGNNIRLRAVGDLSRLPFTVQEALTRDIERTKGNDGLDLILAISYGGREEIVNAARTLARQVQDGEIAPEEITEERFSSSLWTRDIPDPDLLIRSSGEMRISNFLLWQLAYSEIVVIPEYWPEFDETILQRCLDEYAGRERRFGLTSEQVERGGDSDENVNESLAS
jgi:undecaprenyl diphosphate synthase